MVYQKVTKALFALYNIGNTKLLLKNLTNSKTIIDVNLDFVSPYKD